MSKPTQDLKGKPISTIFCDFDDTLTVDSKVIAEVFQAVWQWRKLGKRFVIVSGRPAGWADCLVRTWPIDAMIFENGAGILIPENGKNKVISLAGSDPLAQRTRLEKIFSELKKQFPEAKLASDQAYRLFDYAIDFGEEPPFLSPETVQAILRHLNEIDGVTAKLSSIHVNYWLGQHNKQTGCGYLLKDIWKNQEPLSHFLFCGDSPNDEPLFSHFENSVGVANIAPYLAKMRTPPSYLTNRSGGEGFVELMECLLGDS